MPFDVSPGQRPQCFQPMGTNDQESDSLFCLLVVLEKCRVAAIQWMSHR